MKKIFLFSFCLLLTSCASKLYDNNNLNADWERDSLMCQSYAEGSIPMPQMVPVPQPETVTGSGTVYYNNGQSAPFTYTQTYQPNPYQQFGAGLQNAAASWGAVAARQQRYERCLTHLGWYEVNSSNLQEVRERKINTCLKYIHDEKYSKDIRMKAYSELSMAAVYAKHKVAQYEIGIAYISGEDLKKDTAEGKKYIELSAAQGYQPAIDALAKMQF